MEVKTASRLEDDRLPPTIRLIREASNVLGDHTSGQPEFSSTPIFFTQDGMKQMLLSEKALGSPFLCKVFLIVQAKPGTSSPRLLASSFR